MEALSKTNKYPAYKDRNSNEGEYCLVGEIEEHPCSPGTYYLTLNLMQLVEIIFGKQDEKNVQPVLESVKSLFVC